MIEKLTRHLYKERVNDKVMLVGGLEPHVEDERDFLYGDLGGWFDYKPKNSRVLINTLSVKEQHPYNNCVFQSYVAAREPDEGVELSVRSLTRYAKSKGYVRGDGFSTLREGQKAGVEFGIAEQKLVPESKLGWRDYSGGWNTEEIIKNASEHKAKSYFKVVGKNQWLKALDEGRIIHTGCTWRSAYNQSGGFKSPWVLRWGAGIPVGGHAFVCKGFDYKKGIYTLQNSFGRSWGDKGDFYARFEDLDGIVGYVALDMDEDTVIQLIAKYHDKDVKTKSEPAIYRIEGGKKRPYLNEASYFMNGGSFEPPTYSVVSKKLLDQLPLGKPMP